jgi:hypothetical protein
MLSETLPKSQLPHFLDEIPIPDASRAYLSTDVAGQTEPDADVRQDIKIHQSLLDHSPGRYFIREILENLRHRAGCHTLSALDAKKQIALTGNLTYCVCHSNSSYTARSQGFCEALLT